MHTVIANGLEHCGTNYLNASGSNGELMYFFKISSMSQIKESLERFSLVDIISIPDLSYELITYGVIVVQVNFGICKKYIYILATKDRT